ncbi:hypothetical protein Tco_1381758 [Tanacetum coccineum]
MSTTLSVKDPLSNGLKGCKGLPECKASVSNIRRIQVKDIVKEVEDCLKIYSSAGMNISSCPDKFACKLDSLSSLLVQMANNSIKNDCLAALYGKYNYEEGLIDQDNDSDVEEDQRITNEFMADLNAKYHERALLTNQKRFYKRSGRRINDLKMVKSEKGRSDKGKSDKGLIAESFDWDDESVSSEDEGTTKFKAFMAMAEDDLSVRKVDARLCQWVKITMKKTCSKVTLDQLLSEQVPGNIVKALGGRGRRKESNSSKEVIFTKADESSSEPALEIASDPESECEIEDPLPALPKLTRAESSGTSYNLISLSDLLVENA